MAVSCGPSRSPTGTNTRLAAPPPSALWVLTGCDYGRRSKWREKTVRTQ